MHRVVLSPERSNAIVHSLFTQVHATVGHVSRLGRLRAAMCDSILKRPTPEQMLLRNNLKAKMWFNPINPSTER